MRGRKVGRKADRQSGRQEGRHEQAKAREEKRREERTDGLHTLTHTPYIETLLMRIALANTQKRALSLLADRGMRRAEKGSGTRSRLRIRNELFAEFMQMQRLYKKAE